jgi:hypothetical protein
MKADFADRIKDDFPDLAAQLEQSSKWACDGSAASRRLFAVVASDYAEAGSAVSSWSCRYLAQ